MVRDELKKRVLSIKKQSDDWDNNTFNKFPPEAIARTLPSVQNVINENPTQNMTGLPKKVKRFERRKNKDVDSGRAFLNTNTRRRDRNRFNGKNPAK